jgi:hypothetical protein
MRAENQADDPGGRQQRQAAPSHPPDIHAHADSPFPWLQSDHQERNIS